ncbi:hypothetical protein OKA04_12220 [Luteolibacter flavescens]|uniref:Uncharacterized protein n=1 Tax=Luteolibacter flavescens TaxID=1859460 RepID=A0ABT3FPJ8_9BACT|nr:hypothetical protein [Luteolibacter flavescens]
MDKLSNPDEVFYRRLMSVVDDFGRFDARPAILRSSLYPLRIERVREADIVRSLASCQEAGLIRLYNVDGKGYLTILDFRQQVRAKNSKYPDPPDEEQPLSNCTSSDVHPISDDHLDGDGDGDGNGDGDGDGTPKPPEGDIGPSKTTGRVTERVLPDNWKRIPKGEQKTRKVLRNNRLMERIGGWFNRKPETLWSIAEAGALSQISPPPEDLELLESWYLASNVGERDIRRRDLLTLLNNWSIDLDRARLWSAEMP